MKKRLLYLEDLYDFYSNTYKRSTHFEAEKSGSPIVVQVHGKVNFEKYDKDTEGLCPVHLQACHTNLNVNGSNISDEVMTAALPSFSNRPILGYIHIVDGQPEFYSHNMHEDDDGNIVYDEVPIGIIPESCNAQLVYDEDKKKTYCEVDGYIFEEYSKASEILKREEECSVSVELSIRSLSYNAKEKYLDIEDFFFSGVTILGKTPDGETVKPGMEKSNIKLADFSEKNNGLFSKYEDKMIEFQERLEKLESACSNKDNSKEGGNEETMFEKLLEKYGKTVEDITFEYKNLSDEELEQKFAELFDEENPDDSEGEPSNDGEGEDGSEPEGSPDTGESTDESEDLEENPDDGTYFLNPEKYSITMSDGTVKDFALSLDEITSALYTLVNNMYADDDTWYSVTVYEDGTLIMSDWWNGKYFKQSYTRDGDNFSLVGDRIEVYSVWVTDEEEDALNEMRSNYAALKEFKETVEQNELHAQREEILNSDKYAVLAEKNEEGEYVNANFATLVKEMDNYSLTDLETKVKVMHSDFVSEHQAENMTFSAQTEPKKKITSVKLFANPNNDKKTKPSRYGNLFKENK